MEDLICLLATVRTFNRVTLLPFCLNNYEYGTPWFNCNPFPTIQTEDVSMALLRFAYNLRLLYTFSPVNI